MTSTERKELRYQRRKAKRQEKKLQRSQVIGGLEDVFTFDNLYQAGKKCCNGVRWKNSTQKFEQHLFSETAKIRKQILDKKYKPSSYYRFTINERGKTRVIDAPKIQDRQVQKLFSNKVLLPLYQPDMIWNNGASFKGKGLKFSQEELKKELRYHYRRYGKQGNIILLDFQKFFPTASHKTIFKRHQKLLLNDEIRAFADLIVKANKSCIGMPLGVENSQIEMVAYTSPLDNFVKCQLSMKGAGHYMDDYYIIVPPDQDPKEILKIVIQKAEKLELTVNLSKTRIVSLHKPFRFCKAKYIITDTGKIVVNGNHDSIRRTKHKIKSFYKKIQQKEISYEDLRTSVNSMLAYFESYNDHNKVLKLRRLFYALYGFSLEKIKQQ